MEPETPQPWIGGLIQPPIEYSRLEEKNPPLRQPQALVTSTQAVPAQPVYCTFEDCNRSYTTPRGLRKHITRDHQSRKDELLTFICQSAGCGRKFSSRSGLGVHVNKSHPSEQVRPFECRSMGCEKTFVSKDSRAHHEKVTHGGFKRSAIERPAASNRPTQNEASENSAMSGGFFDSAQNDNSSGNIAKQRQQAPESAVIAPSSFDIPTEYRDSEFPCRCTHPGCQQSFSHADFLEIHAMTHATPPTTHSSRSPYILPSLAATRNLHTCHVANCGKTYGKLSHWKSHQGTAHGRWKCTARSCMHESTSHAEFLAHKMEAHTSPRAISVAEFSQNTTEMIAAGENPQMANVGIKQEHDVDIQTTESISKIKAEPNSPKVSRTVNKEWAPEENSTTLTSTGMPHMPGGKGPQVGQRLPSPEFIDNQILAHPSESIPVNDINKKVNEFHGTTTTTNISNHRPNATLPSFPDSHHVTAHPDHLTNSTHLNTYQSMTSPSPSTSMSHGSADLPSAPLQIHVNPATVSQKKLSAVAYGKMALALGREEMEATPKRGRGRGPGKLANEAEAQALTSDNISESLSNPHRMNPTKPPKMTPQLASAISEYNALTTIAPNTQNQQKLPVDPLWNPDESHVQRILPVTPYTYRPTTPPLQARMNFTTGTVLNPIAVKQRLALFRDVYHHVRLTRSGPKTTTATNPAATAQDAAEEKMSDGRNAEGMRGIVGQADGTGAGSTPSVISAKPNPPKRLIRSPRQRRKYVWRGGVCKRPSSVVKNKKVDGEGIGSGIHVEAGAIGAGSGTGGSGGSGGGGLTVREGGNRRRGGFSDEDDDEEDLDDDDDDEDDDEGDEDEQRPAHVSRIGHRTPWPAVNRDWN